MLHIEAKDKIFVCKLDNLLKHASKCKVKVASCGVEIVSFYFNLKIQHAHSKKGYTIVNCPSILDLVAEVPHDKKYKVV